MPVGVSSLSHSFSAVQPSWPESGGVLSGSDVEDPSQVV